MEQLEVKKTQNKEFFFKLGFHVSNLHFLKSQFFVTQLQNLLFYGQIIQQDNKNKNNKKQTTTTKKPKEEKRKS